MFNKPIETHEDLIALAQSSYTKVFELLHTGIAILSLEGIFLYANKAYLNTFNLKPDTVGKHVSKFFLTSEQGVMTTIRTKKMTICSSITKDNSQGVSFRYPVLNSKGDLIGVIIENISTSIGKDKLLSLLETVRNIEEQAEYLERKSHKKQGMLFTFDNLVGESVAMLAMCERGKRFAKNSEPILLIGESGTGKELVAQALHSASDRAGKPFVTVNCAALPQELIESELFGYESGAFTGAKSGGMKGKFEMANRGTIFLDEIGELPLQVQAKLLRVLESGEVQKIAHTGKLVSDFRLIAATNKDLNALVTAGSFREDLYHRLNIIELAIPPLRERTSDIPLLTRHFIEQAVGHKRSRKIQVSNELYSAFAEHFWRGNIRELKNILTYALYNMEDNETILGIGHLPDRFFREQKNDAIQAPKFQEESNLSKAGAQAERKILLTALISTQYNKTKAAKILGISRNTLYRKMRELGLTSTK